MKKFSVRACLVFAVAGAFMTSIGLGAANAQSSLTHLQNFANLDSCINVGEYGRAQVTWGYYECNKTGPDFWQLLVLY